MSEQSTEDRLEWWEDSSESRQQWMTEQRKRDAYPREPTTSAQIPSPITVDSSTTSDCASMHKTDGSGPSEAAKASLSKEDEGGDGDQQILGLDVILLRMDNLGDKYQSDVQAFHILYLI